MSVLYLFPIYYRLQYFINIVINIAGGSPRSKNIIYSNCFTVIVVDMTVKNLKLEIWMLQVLFHVVTV